MRCNAPPIVNSKKVFFECLYTSAFFHIRINCIGLLGLHHLFYKGVAVPLGLQGCGPLGLQLCAFTGAASLGAGPRGSHLLYKCSPSPFNRII
jgi:hypothetical protein